MDKRLNEVLSGGGDNYLLPFLWQHDGNREKLREQVRLVHQSGARALCVESRPHEHFGEDEWWGDMEEVLSEAETLGMNVWILDDKHFPTGYANGLIPKKYPERRKWQLIERHVDMIGPMENASLLVPQLDEEDELLGVVAYPRAQTDEIMENRPIDVTDCVKNRFLYWTVPDGVWRVYYFIKTRKHHNRREGEYIHLIDAESVRVLIEAVYEPHYEKLGKYFGNTLVGFFSDEPSLGNDFFAWSVPNNGMYDMKIGMVGLALPWSDELFAEMKRALGHDALLQFAALWYPVGDIAPQVRYTYMDIVTRLYRDHFCRQLGDWCRAHGVQYIGHIIEDMNAHGRLGCSGGHYFRSLDGQDMSGIDIVLHQIMPGLGHYKSSAITAGGYADPEFFHYVLAKLGSSMAHINPQTKGRAMCEVFGAYGWAEGVPMMKWLMDHLIVRGINHFVPHAFSPKFPDPDCPPHFGAAGKDPQFEGFSKLMAYVNRAAHIFCGAEHVANAAILYHAEAEWMSGEDCMLTQAPAKALYDAQIDYDIVPMDALTGEARVRENTLLIHETRYDCLIIPRAPRLPQALVRVLNAFARAGLPILYVDGAPLGVQSPDIVSLRALSATLIDRGMTDVRVKKAYPLLRVNHVRREDTDYFMFFNESVIDTVDTEVELPCAGAYARLNLLDQEYALAEAEEGLTRVRLAPYESVVYAFGAHLPEGLQAAPAAGSAETPDLLYDVDICTTCEYPNFTPYKRAVKPFNLTGAEELPDFTGFARYTAELVLENELPAFIDLGAVGQTAKLTVNGQALGMRICTPYRFDVRGALKEGTNRIEIETANTLVHEVKDVFSSFIQIPPSGLIGPVKLVK